MYLDFVYCSTSRVVINKNTSGYGNSAATKIAIFILLLLWCMSSEIHESRHAPVHVFSALKPCSKGSSESRKRAVGDDDEHFFRINRFSPVFLVAGCPNDVIRRPVLGR